MFNFLKKLVGKVSKHDADKKRIFIDSPELLALLDKKGALIDEGRVISGKIEDLQTELNKKGLQVQKVKDKITVAVDELMKPHLGEYEFWNHTEIVDGKVAVDYVNAMEEFKTNFPSFKKKNNIK